jgi:3-oxoacyl-ACP reductase-like protein
MPRTARDQSATGIYHVMIRDAVIKACGLRSISDFQLLTLERRKSVIQEVMQSLDVRPRQLSRVTGMNYETIRNIAKKLP